MFGHIRRAIFRQSDSDTWRTRWQSIVPPECRDVPITVNEKTVVAFVQINHYVMMLQDGLLMEESFFDVCDHFMLAGYHIIWLMRCTQDLENRYLKLARVHDHGKTFLWNWKKPTTNFGRWLSDNRQVSIILQFLQVPDGPLSESGAKVLQRVQWAESADSEKMIPSRTRFATVADPGTPKELAALLNEGYRPRASDRPANE